MKNQNSFRKAIETGRIKQAIKSGSKEKLNKAIQQNRKMENNYATNNLSRKNGGIESVTEKRDGKTYKYKNGKTYFITYY